MIKGIGVDIVRVNRIQKIINKWGSRFLYRVYTNSEINYCKDYSNPVIHYAGRFAVKEAAVKMLGTELAGISWHDFEVVNTSEGKPELYLSGQAAYLQQKKGIDMVHVSISHEKEYAVAQVIGEGGYK